MQHLYVVYNAVCITPKLSYNVYLVNERSCLGDTSLSLSSLSFRCLFSKLVQTAVRRRRWLVVVLIKTVYVCTQVQPVQMIRRIRTIAPCDVTMVPY